MDYGHVRNTFKQALRYGRYKALSFMRDEEVQFALYDLSDSLPKVKDKLLDDLHKWLRRMNSVIVYDES